MDNEHLVCIDFLPVIYNIPICIMNIVKIHLGAKYPSNCLILFDFNASNQSQLNLY